MRTSPHALLLLFFLVLSGSLLAQQPAKSKTKTTKKANTNQPVANDTTAMATDTTTLQGGGGGTGSALYTATYSSQFAIGNPAHAQMILAQWKDWDDNMLDRNAAMIADTIMLEMSNGQIIRGKDSFLLSGKQYRSQLASVKTTAEAWMPLRSTDRNEDWVVIWGVEENTAPDGTKTKSRIHEVWRINRDGKIDYLRQYAAKSPVQ